MNKEDAEVLYQGLRNIANSITPMSAAGSTDAMGGYVSSLTEAMMGHTRALSAIADALENIAHAIEGLGDSYENVAANSKTR